MRMAKFSYCSRTGCGHSIGSHEHGKNKCKVKNCTCWEVTFLFDQHKVKPTKKGLEERSKRSLQ
jgi:hypothetical protein